MFDLTACARVIADFVNCYPTVRCWRWRYYDRGDAGGRGRSPGPSEGLRVLRQRAFSRLVELLHRRLRKRAAPVLPRDLHRRDQARPDAPTPKICHLCG
ncbi:hypothetical protein [Hymenobacter edaphi]|uniref:hypothetical protein n=1 Tax=Hymenobacter edaphi TaxID=2211146 RepID=UPI0010581EBD|nr:hypothetical protein [Hymenobacter edaphi]